MKHGLHLVFKTERIRSEFFDSRFESARRMMLWQAEYIYKKYGHPLEVTGIWRDDLEQEALYPDEPDRTSKHQVWSAYDAKVRGLGYNEHVEIEVATNQHFRYKHGFGIQPCMYHRNVAPGQGSNEIEGYHLHNELKE